MTQVLDPPSNGNAETHLVRADRQRMIVADSSQFQNLLDTGKFEHLWRVAQLFASSQLVPEAFQDKPADCLIATQMAIRLGVDPFMFMQNTYVYKGKPGMEGKLAIALINSSGLFRGPLRYDLGGTGDARGCTAWAVDKDTGERIEGPRVTIATAKAEGWYGQNKKWQTIPDLMLQYRAGSWFGRLICPERLMGMQTIEELHDTGAAVAPAVTSVRAVDRLNAKIAERRVPHPTDEGRIIDQAPEINDSTQSAAGPNTAEAQAAPFPPSPLPADEATMTEIDAPSPAPSRPAAAPNATARGRAVLTTDPHRGLPGKDLEQPVPERTVDTSESQVAESWEDFEASMWAIVEVQNPDRDRFNAAVLKSIKAAKKRSGHELAQFDRTLIARAIEQQRGHFAYLQPDTAAKGA